jgi:hypothetical protein
VPVLAAEQGGPTDRAAAELGVSADTGEPWSVTAALLRTDFTALDQALLGRA